MCDYIVVNDGTFALNPVESQTYSDSIPSNLVIGTNRAKPILAFKAWPTPSGGGRFEVEVNDQIIWGPTISGGDVRGLWETFSGEVLNPGINNTVQLRATENKIWFSDSVLWFQVEA